MRTMAKKSSVQKVPTERDESMALVKWAKMMVDTGQEPRLRLLRCGFEGLRLGMGMRMQVKRQSVSRGWPDLFLAVPRMTCPAYGLFIELKRVKGGTVSAEQAIMIGDLNAMGYKAIMCRGADHAISEIKRYLGMSHQLTGNTG